MKTIKAETLLDVSVESTGLSEQFCAQCRLMGFQTIKNIIEISPAELVTRKEFSYTWLGELSSFLNQNKLLYLLQPIPGKSYG